MRNFKQIITVIVLLLSISAIGQNAADFKDGVKSKGEKVYVYPTQKKWVIFGDSFSNSLTGDYPKIVIDNIGLTGTVTNAVGGHKVENQLTVLDGLLLGDPNYLDDFDILSLHAGVNDYAGASTVLGNRTDAAGASTFVGALKDFIETVLTAKPTIELYIITPPEANGAGVLYKADNVQGWTLNELTVLMSQVSSDYGVQCIDLYAKTQFNLQTIPTLTTDGLHPSTEGQQIIGDIVSDSFSNKTNQGRAIDISSLTDRFVPYSDNNSLSPSPINSDGTNVWMDAAKRIKFVGGEMNWGGSGLNGQLTWDTNKAVLRALSGNDLILKHNTIEVGIITANKLSIDNVINLKPSTQPGSAAEGDIYFDGGTKKARCYDGTIWNDLF